MPKTNKRGQQKATTRKSYSLTKKIAIVTKAKTMGRRNVARQEGISYSQLKRWTNQVADITSLVETRGIDGSVRTRMDGCGRKCVISKNTEDELCEWVINLRNETTDDGPIRVDMPMCLTRVRQIDPSLIEVKRAVLRRRLWRIFKRRRITERAITHHAQKTRNCQEIINGWADYIKEKMAMLGINHSSICNFDETNVFFAPQAKKTLESKGTQTVAALMAESNQRCTAMIGVTGDGDAFPPYIVFKGKDSAGGTINRQLARVQQQRENHDEYEGFPTSCFYAVQGNAWMDSELIVDWIYKVYAPWAATKDGPTMLILDEFSGHMTGEVRDAVVDCGGFLEFIPGGYTWRLQVMDVGVNKTFKDSIRDAHDQWAYEAGYNAKPQRCNVATWIKSSYDNIRPSTIVKTWRKVGLPIEIEHPNEDDGEDSDVEEEDDDGIDFLDFASLNISEQTEEEEQADEHYNEYLLLTDTDTDESG